MFHENLKTLRKSRGLSQEELAIRLNVVRQTVSKWEKGLSVPDAEMLLKIAEVFEVPVSRLLGAKMEDEEDRDNVAEQLARINEQLAVRNRRARRIWKVIVSIFAAILILAVIVWSLSIFFFVDPGSRTEENNTIGQQITKVID